MSLYDKRGKTVAELEKRAFLYKSLCTLIALGYTYE
jgi:hypothetical protein